MRGLTIIVLAALAGCGGQSQSRSDDPRGALGTAGSGASGGTRSEMDGGPDAGGSPSVAGVPGYVSQIHSGTRTCQNEDYCFGLACYAPPTFEPTVCVARCAADADCLPFEACTQTTKLEPTCYARCDSPQDCLDGFDCYDVNNTGSFVCFPAAWAQRGKELD